MSILNISTCPHLPVTNPKYDKQWHAKVWSDFQQVEDEIISKKYEATEEIFYIFKMTENEKSLRQGRKLSQCVNSLSDTLVKESGFPFLCRLLLLPLFTLKLQRTQILH